jgi:hypothetical protein
MFIAIRLSPHETSEEGQNTNHKLNISIVVAVTMGRHSSTLHIMQNTIIVELSSLVNSFVYGVHSFHVS